MRWPQVALKGVLYGGKQRIDVQRLQRLAAGFTQFTVDGLAAEPALLPATNVCPTPLLHPQQCSAALGRSFRTASLPCGHAFGGSATGGVGFWLRLESSQPNVSYSCRRPQK